MSSICAMLQERVDSAMNDIVLELVTKYRGGLNPEVQYYAHVQVLQIGI